MSSSSDSEAFESADEDFVDNKIETKTFTPAITKKEKTSNEHTQKDEVKFTPPILETKNLTIDDHKEEAVNIDTKLIVESNPKESAKVKETKQETIEVANPENPENVKQTVSETSVIDLPQLKERDETNKAVKEIVTPQSKEPEKVSKVEKEPIDVPQLEKLDKIKEIESCDIDTPNITELDDWKEQKDRANKTQQAVSAAVKCDDQEVIEKDSVEKLEKPLNSETSTDTEKLNTKNSEKKTTGKEILPEKEIDATEADGWEFDDWEEDAEVVPTNKNISEKKEDKIKN